MVEQGLLAGKPTASNHWSRYIGPLLTLVTVLGIELLSHTAVAIPNPPAILVLLVVFAAFRGGLYPGFLSAAFTWLYIAYFFSLPDQQWTYTEENLRRILIWSVVLPCLVLLVGGLKQRADRAFAAALQASEDRFIKVMRASPVAISITAMADDRIIDVNDSFLQLLGYPREAIIGRTTHELQMWAHPTDYARLIQILEHQGAVQNVETQFVTTSGTIRDVLASMELIDSSGERAVLMLIFDITEHKRLTAHLAQAQKMESVGQLAGGIAHDFNNLLTVILGTVDLSLRTLPDHAPMRSDLLDIRQAAQHGAQLIQQLLIFARKQPFEPHILDLNGVILRLMPLLQSLVGPNVKLIFHPYPQLGYVHADPAQLEQVILNLVINAHQAMPEGGTLTITTTSVEYHVSSLQRSTPCNTPKHSRLIVQDTGVGMSPEVQARVFEPFFTTKAVGKGTGLGLATCYGIVEQHSGTINVISKEGQGTTFIIDLPQVDGLPDALTDIADTEALPCRS